MHVLTQAHPIMMIILLVSIFVIPSGSQQQPGPSSPPAKKPRCDILHQIPRTHITGTLGHSYTKITVDRENFAVKIISRLRPAAKI